MAKKNIKKKSSKECSCGGKKECTCESSQKSKPLSVITKGAVIFEPGSTKKYKTGEWRTFKPTIDLARCIKCGRCWMVCPDAAINQRKEDGKFEINHDYCKGCLLCTKECPVKCIPYVVEEK